MSKPIDFSGIKVSKSKDRWSCKQPNGKTDYYDVTPNELPVCCDDIPKEVDRFDPAWKNGARGTTYECKKCGNRWCNCSRRYDS